jgi:hypothetical protein
MNYSDIQFLSKPHIAYVLLLIFFGRYIRMCFLVGPEGLGRKTLKFGLNTIRTGPKGLRADIGSLRRFEINRHVAS